MRFQKLIIVILLLLVPAGFGLHRLHLDVDVLNLLPGDLPVVAGLQQYQRHFANSRELIITVEGDTAETTAAAAQALAEALRAQTNLVGTVAWQPAWMERPDLAAELIAYLWLNQPPAVFSQLTNRLEGTGIKATLEEAREQLATSMSPLELAKRGYDPFNLLTLPESVSGQAPAAFGESQNLFSSPEGTFRLVYVQARGNISQYQHCIAWLKTVQSTAQAALNQPSLAEVKIAYTGGPAFLAEIAGGMQEDMTLSVLLTAVIIAILFWLAHRRWRPMLWLLFLLGAVLAGTLALGGLFFGTINVVSLGFAGILLGLAVDYGVVHYQEAMASPQATIPEIRSAIGPSIFWAAITTISAFLVLHWGGLPGLAQLGSLVALGVALSALVMLFAFLPPLFPERMKRGAGSAPPATHSVPSPSPQIHPTATSAVIRWGSAPVLVTAVLILLTAVILFWRGLPTMDPTSAPLRPRHSAAYAALDRIKALLAQGQEPLWLITHAGDEPTIARRLDAITPLLNNAVSNGLVSGYILPTLLWPRAEDQAANRPVIARLIAQKETLHQAVLQAGFTTNAWHMTRAMLGTWENAAAQKSTFWPTNPLSRWVLDKVVARDNGELYAVGFVFPSRTNRAGADLKLKTATAELARNGFILSGWELLGGAIMERVQQNLPKVVWPMVLLILFSLWLAFRQWREIALSLAVLGLSGLCLMAVMKVAGWQWNLLNLMALPLMLGTGVDYSIFMQLALRRHGGDRLAAYRSVGRALLLCGGTAIAGFASLAWSTNAGMASLGLVCAVGIAGNMLISVLLLPVWWNLLACRPAAPSHA